VDDLYEKDPMTKPANHGKTKPYYAVSLERGLSVLRCFTSDRPTWSLSQISKAIRLNKTSTFRYVNTLIELGYLKRDPQTKMLRLGPQILIFSLGYLHSTDLREIARPLIDEVSETHDITIELAVYEEDTMVVLYRREASQAFGLRFPISRRKEQFYLSAIGKTILAHLSHADINDLLGKIDLIPKTENTFTQKEALIDELSLTRKRGYALNNEEWMQGVIGIAAPVMDQRTDSVVGAVCFDFLTLHHSIPMIENEFADIIINLADNISRLVEIHG